MGAAAKKDQEPENTEYKRPDAAKAFEIYDKQIKPKKAHISTLTGDLSQPFDDIKSHAHFPRKVLDFIIALEDLEDFKRDHFLLALSEGLKHRKLYLPSDLVTRAQGNDGGPVVPAGERPALKLATLPEDDFEASEEELAQQTGRGSDVTEPEAEAAE